MTSQVPTAAKIKFLEGELKVGKEAIPNLEGNALARRELEYQMEVLQAILADYKNEEYIERTKKDFGK